MPNYMEISASTKYEIEKRFKIKDELLLLSESDNRHLLNLFNEKVEKLWTKLKKTYVSNNNRVAGSIGRTLNMHKEKPIICYSSDPLITYHCTIPYYNNL